MQLHTPDTRPRTRITTHRVLPLFMGILMLFVAACGGGNNTPTSSGKAPDDQQILVKPVEGRSELQTFDPALATESAAINAINMVFTGLVELDDKLQVQDQLAASHSLAADGVTWTFKLKPGLKFSDGTPLTSADVAYSLDRALTPDLKSPVSPVYLGLLKDADKRFSGAVPSLINDSILTPDSQTVVLIAKSKAAYFLQILTYQTSFVVEKSMIQKYGNNFATHLSEGIGGDGPFKVASYTPNKDIEFVPNPNYYGPKPKLKKVVMVFYKQADTVYRAYQANQVDSSSVSSTEIASAKQLPNGQYHSIPQLDVEYFTMNYLVKPFDNLKIRQAFALSIDKDAIAHNVFKDAAIPSNHIVPQGMPGYNENLTATHGVTSTKGNAELAKQLFAEGLKDENLTVSTFPQITFTVSTLGLTDWRNMFAAVQQMWQKNLGVTVKIQDEDFNKLLDDRNSTVNNPKGMQMWALDWSSDYPDPQDWLTLIFDKGSPKNAFNYGQNSTPLATEQQANQLLMEQADVNADQQARLKQYNQAEQALIDDVAWIPVYQSISTLVRKPCVIGVVDNAQGFTPPDDWTNIYISDATPCANTKQYS
ncbi:ABC transporter substrate-binding protein [Ktedonobacter sp. SOSP1-85]|uniref:peptide ABC transporter substrate-binding protein n=1 Tax=Ktedonobacter sp. SOSP1-85 TaxID=2778367 RepID=UPI0019162793|nr:peptide ABC transporter substrate-binding protein [Ktedonobacter sp. SOSP1-85]GHO80961.1 ABC transporter substrate-binding protein [Ktedonobacter sp. SOSP1-85]